MKEQLVYKQIISALPDIDQIAFERERQKYWAKKTATLKKFLGYEIKEVRLDLGDLHQRDPEEVIASLITTARPDIFDRPGRVIDIDCEQMFLVNHLPAGTIYAGLKPKASEFFRQHESDFKSGARILPVDWEVTNAGIPFPAGGFRLALSPYLISGKFDIGGEIARVLKPRGKLVLKGTAHLLTKPEMTSLRSNFTVRELWHITYSKTYDPFLEKTITAWQRYLVFAFCQRNEKNS